MTSWVFDNLSDTVKQMETQRVLRRVYAPFLLGITTTATAALTTSNGTLLFLIAFIPCLVAGVAIAYIDSTERRIPDVITAPLATYLLGFVIIDLIVRHLNGETITPYAIGIPAGAAIAGGAFLIAGLAGVTGLGDVKLAAIIGAILTPYYGIETTIGALVLAHVLAVPHAIVSIQRKRRAPSAMHDEEIPFGPYLVAGALIALLATHCIGS